LIVALCDYSIFFPEVELQVIVYGGCHVGHGDGFSGALGVYGYTGVGMYGAGVCGIVVLGTDSVNVPSS
jgi:hypothetical protein